MTKITIYTDCHIGSKYLEKNILPTTIEQVEAENSFSIGDNYELKNAEKSNILKLNLLYIQHMNLFNGRFCSGNHDLGRDKNYFNLVKEIGGKTVLFTHGDFPLWGEKKSMDFRNEKAGQGSGLIQKFLSSHTGGLSKGEKKQLSDYANKYGADVLCCGHLHVKHVFDEAVNGVRIICCPRGRTEIEI